MHHTQHSIEALAIGIGNKVTVTGGAAAVVSGAAEKVGVVTMVNSAGSLDVAGWCAIGGVACAFLGLLVSVYFQWRRDRREAIAFRLKSGFLDE